MELGSFKFKSPELERFCLKWKEPSEVGKFHLDLESFLRSWKVSELIKAFQFHYSLSNFKCTFQLRPRLSNFGPSFSTCARAFQLLSFQFHSELSNSTFFPIALSDYTYPFGKSQAIRKVMIGSLFEPIR